SLQMLYEGYLIMLENSANKTGWGEENLSAHYIECMKNSRTFISFPVSIIPEPRLYDRRHTHEGVSAKKAPRIDIQFTWQSKSNYTVEAKILFEYAKKRGSGITAQSLTCHKRYIATGIEHFLSSHYPLPGCLVGYVVEGDTQQIVSSINNLIASNGPSPRVGEIQQEAIPRFPELYFSTHQTASGGMHLNHFMLKL
ncbi:MAG: hypothetical protein Q7T20_10925, partial [Saprospiraceae bacterium]|nr:hypothetical protein [Saprospiraceae bacterium]